MQPSCTVATQNGNGRRHLAGLYWIEAAARHERVGTDAARRTGRFQQALHGADYFSKRVGTGLGHEAY